MPARSYAAALGRRLTLSVLASKHTVGEREKREKCHPRRAAFRQDIELGLAMKNAVLILHADEMGSLWQCRGLCLAKLLHGAVGAADFSNLSGLNELV